MGSGLDAIIQPIFQKSQLINRSLIVGLAHARKHEGSFGEILENSPLLFISSFIGLEEKGFLPPAGFTEGFTYS